MENWRMDLHTHTTASDGSLQPKELVKSAYNAGIRMLAVSDHDTVRGLSEAKKAASEFSDMTLIAGVELNTDFTESLHMLGLGIDPENKDFVESLELCKKRRDERNEKMVEKLAEGGYDIRPYLKSSWYVVTRAQIALALVEAGYVKDKAEAFKELIGDDCPYYLPTKKFSPKESIEIIKNAGGYPILAHPCLMSCNIPKLVQELVGYGLMGIEAYYSKATPGQTKEHLSLARQYNLFVTCGSDFHGAAKPEVELGCAWQDKPELWETHQMLTEKKYA